VAAPANAARKALATADVRLRISDRATSSFVDVAPVAESDDDHGEDLIVDRDAEIVRSGFYFVQDPDRAK